MSGWRDLASCRDMDPDLWFSARDSTETETAIRICEDCPVRAECKRWADAHPRYHGYPLTGVWGGEYRTWRQG